MRASQLHIAGNLSADHVSHTEARLLFGARQRYAYEFNVHTRESEEHRREARSDGEEHRGTSYLECCVFWRPWSVLVQRDLLFFHMDHHLNKDTEQ